MSRAAAATYLADEFPELLADAGITDLDEAGGLKGAIDRALAWLGTPTADLAAATVENEDAYKAALDWAVLLRIKRAVAGRWYGKSVGTPSVSVQKQQAFANLNELLADAEARASAYIVVVADGGAWTVTGIGADWIEPGIEAVA